MRLSKFLFLITFVTFFSLLYVHQQSEIFRLAYVGQKNKTACDDLLDANSVLRYNIKRRASLAQLGGKVGSGADFQMPNSYRLVRVVSSSQGLKLAEQPRNRETLVSRILGVRRQAEARSINP